jgi:hypothetical protein
MSCVLKCVRLSLHHRRGLKLPWSGASELSANHLTIPLSNWLITAALGATPPQYLRLVQSTKLPSLQLNSILYVLSQECIGSWITSYSLSSRIANKASTLFLCLLAGWPSGKSHSHRSAAARGQCRHKEERKASAFYSAFYIHMLANCP